MRTAVIGAGPAGLLFGLIARIRFIQAGDDPTRWSVSLFDRRATYSRTHRVRIDAAVFRDIQRDLQHPLFDELCTFLEHDGYSPEVNVLEERLLDLNARLGIRREQLAVGDAPGECSLSELRQRLLGDADSFWTIVAADSVHSTIGRLVGPDLVPLHATHEQLVRLSIRGPGLPRDLSAVHQYRLSKVLGSVLTYRINSNGFAEVDLFLTPLEHGAVAQLGANPREPVELLAERLGALRAPLFGRVVALFSRGFGEGACSVHLQSTFRLEHSVSPRRVFRLEQLNAIAFLVGDAAVALPFQRGISCMGRCADELAKIHCELLEAPAERRDAIAARYDPAVEAILRRELRVVRARASLVRGLREFVRITSLLPFPIQSWFLSVRPEQEQNPRVTPGFALNAAIALLASAAAWAGQFGTALTLEAMGGLVYRAALTFEPPPHGLVKKVWQAQIATWLILGVTATVRASAQARAISDFLPSVVWWIAGFPFAAGIYLFELLGNRWWKAGDFEPEQ
jgi:hypothetical protein